MKRIVLIGLVALTAASCKKNNDDVLSNELAPISVEFDNVVGDQNLILNNGVYTNANGQQFSVTTCNYFVSNFVFTKTDVTIYTVPQDSSYFLVRENLPATRFATMKVPQGDYAQVQFIIGVDSLRSTMDISRRTGVLDPSGGHDGMYWTWNSGYIFLKLEGTSPAAPADANGNRRFRFHIGGFGGYSSATINNIKQVTLNLTNRGIAKVRTNRNANVHLFANIAQVMNGTTNVNLSTNATTMFNAFSTQIANNYQNMFTHDHTEN